MQESLYKALVNKSVQLYFGINTSASPASYHPESKGITFANTESITSASLKEELFHAWQDAYYPGGISQYGKDTQGNKSEGYVNIEFEAKFFKDLLNNPEMYNGCCYAFSNYYDYPKGVYDEYQNWIYGIRDSENISFQDNDYQRWLKLFQQYDTNYTSPMSNDLSTPDALRNLIDNSTCLK